MKSIVKQILLASGLALFSFSGAVSAAFIVESDGVVLDTATSLEWEPNANHGNFTWAQANAYANGVVLDGPGWRLPVHPRHLPPDVLRRGQIDPGGGG